MVKVAERVFLWLFFVGVCQLTSVQSGCRVQEEKCSPVCVLNPKSSEMECNLRASLIFTNSSQFEASLQKVTSEV